MAPAFTAVNFVVADSDPLSDSVTPWRTLPRPQGGPTRVDVARDFTAEQIAREQAFHHLTAVEVTVNGRPHWSKSWAVSVPRVGC